MYCQKLVMIVEGRIHKTAVTRGNGKKDVAKFATWGV